MEATKAYHTSGNFNCGCMNGGTCEEHGCLCPSGFEGLRCGTTTVDFMSSFLKKNYENILFVAFISTLLLFTVALIAFFVWRRVRSVRKKRRTARRQEKNEVSAEEDNSERDSRLDQELFIPEKFIDLPELLNNSFQDRNPVVICLHEADLSVERDGMNIDAIGKSNFQSNRDSMTAFRDRGEPKRKRSLGISR